MGEKVAAKGRCLCGAVQVDVAELNTQVGVCHCNMCRTWTGGPLMAVDCGTAVVFSGEDHISVYDSSAWAQRGFCARCGTHLFYRLKESGQCIMPVGLFDEPAGLHLHHQIFVDEQPAWYAFHNDTEKLTGAEVFAKYAPPE